MGKKKDQARAKKAARLGAANGRAAAPGGGTAAAAAATETELSERPPMRRKVFETELEALQVELVRLQEWVKYTGAKVCVLFEGRDLLRLPTAELRRMRRHMQIVFQDPLDALDPRWTAAEILGEALERPDAARVTRR